MRMGHIHRPVYRISVADSRRAPTGKFIEHIGTYDPHLDKLGHKMLRLNVARAKYWIAHGAQPSSVVARLLSRFHLLPVPPQRQLALVDPLVFKVLAGEDVRPELFAQTRARQTAELNGNPAVLVHPVSLGNRRQKELTPERIEQVKRQSPWKLQTFPFDYNPTTKTMAAWNQARLFHQPDPLDGVIDLGGRHPDEIEFEAEQAEEEAEERKREAEEARLLEEEARQALAKSAKEAGRQEVDAEGADAQTATVDDASTPSEADLKSETAATTIDIEAESATTTPIDDASKKQ